MFRFTISEDRLKLRKLDTISNRKNTLLNCAMHLDTETSHNHDDNNNLGWIESICYEFNNEIVILRKPSQFIFCLNKIKEYYLLGNTKLVIYVHNLSYDIEYLKDWLISEYGNNYKILAISPHKFISFEIDCFIFKCSYRLSNKSLNKWSNDLNTLHKKLVGTVDYETINYQDTILTKNQIKYQYYDVIVLKECLVRQMEIYNDNLLTIPLTATSYIRREILRNFKKDRHNNRKIFEKQRMNTIIYKLCRFAFAGGYTHGNRFLKAQTLNGKIRHRDFVSHYPSQLRVNKYPMGQWFLLTNKDITIDDLLSYTNEYCLLIEIELTNLTIKKGVTMPFAQYDKFYKGKCGFCKFISDNGRILSMEGKSIIVCTELDIQILNEQYTFSKRIIQVYASKSDYLPKYLVDTIDYFFRNKTHYKEVVETLKENGYNDYDELMLDANTDLMKSKNGLNSTYGCCATDIVRLIITMSENGEWNKQEINDELITENLNNFYKNPKSTLSYAWGVWCTAYARYELYLFISRCIGYDKVIYCDTDSIFYFSNEKIENKIIEMNKRHNLKALNLKAYIETEKGTRVYYDNFKDENENIKQFRFLHSKCYCYIEENENKHLTIAGVTALSADRKTNRMEELGNIDNLKSGFIFTKCGGTLSKYIQGKPRIELINNHQIELSSACIILPNTKTLNDKSEEIDIDYVEEWEVFDDV